MRRYTGKRFLLWTCAQVEEGRNGGTEFNEEAKGRIEVCSGCSERITDETAGSEDRKHTSGGVSVAVDSNLGAVVGVEEGAIDSTPGNEGIIAQARV